MPKSEYLPQLLAEDAEAFFSEFGSIRTKPMFGGEGVYSGLDIFALIFDDAVFVKTDDALRDKLESYGGKAFEWTRPETGETIQMSFVSLPDCALKRKDKLISIAKQSLEISTNMRREKVKSPRRFAF